MLLFLFFPACLYSFLLLIDGAGYYELCGSILVCYAHKMSLLVI